MSLMARDTGGGDFELAPEGNHIARCYQVIDLGIQTIHYQGEEKKTHKVHISWELPSTPMEDGKPFMIFNQYTLSLHENANLRAHLQSWRGRSFTDIELEDFDIEKLLGVPCMVNVVHNTVTNGKTYANVMTVTPIPKGLECPMAVNDPVKYSIETHDEAVYQALPEWMRKKINREVAQPAAQEAPPAIDPNDFTDDDIPF